MKNTFEIISNTFHSVKSLIYLLVIVALLALTTTAFAQTRCPIEYGLYNYKSIKHHYDTTTLTYTKIYDTDLGLVKVIMKNVSQSSYEIHRYSHTIPTNLKDNITVKWNEKQRIVDPSTILESTRQK